MNPLTFQHSCALRTFLDQKLQHFVLHEPQIYQMSSIYVLRKSHISIIFAFGNPNTVAAWKWTTCPFGVFPCVEAIFVQFEANPCDEEFRLFMGAAQTHRVLFDTHYGPIRTPKTLHFLRKMLNFDANNTTNFGKNKRTNGSIFTHVHPNTLIFSSVFVPREPTQPEKSPGLPCVSLEPELRNRLIGICGTPTPQKTTNAGV